MHARVIAISLLFLAMTVGAGCTRASTKKTRAPQQPFEPLVWLPTSTPSTEKPLAPLDELRNAISAFQNVKSFKSKLYVDNNGEKTTAQIDVLKPARFRGTIHIASSDKDAEIIGVDASLYIKPANSDWVEISSPTMSKQLNEAFRSAANGSGTLINTALPEGTVVSKKFDKLHGCDSYTTTLTPPKGDPINLVVCVANGLPSLLDIQTADSHVSVEYQDYNSLFIIERPTVRK